MSGSSNNSWTILAPESQERAAAETLRPLTEGTQDQDEPSALTEGDGAQGLPEEDHLTSEETITEPCEEADPSARQHCPVPDAQTEEKPEQESFSDSYSHLGAPTEDCPAPPLSTETLGHLGSGQGEEETGPTEVQDETQHQSVSQELQEEESKEETELPRWSPLETPQEPSVQTEPLTAQEPETELRKRRSLLEQIGRHDEEEEAEEDFQLPQREDDSGITLNKCILGAVILLGLGTIFISGVFLDLDDEGDPSGELKDSETSGKQEWLNPDVARAAAEVDSTDLLNKLNKGNEHIAMFETQLKSQNEELKVAMAQAAGGSTEHLRQQEEVEERNTAATSPPGGQTEDYIQRPVDQQVHSKDKHDRGVREEQKEKSEWKKEKKQRKDGGKMEGKDKEWKRDRSEGEKMDKKRKDDKHREDEREWKSKRGDEGKTWKEKKDWKEKDEKREWKEKDKKRDWKEKDEKREWKKDEKRDWKKDEKRDWKEKDGKREWQKNEKKEWNDRNDRKSKHDGEWKSQEERKDFKDGKRHGEKHKGPEEKEWKNGRNGHKEESKEKYERKHWKEQEGYESRNRKDNGEKKEWSENGKKWKKKEDWNEKEEWNAGEKKPQKEWYEGKVEKQQEGRAWTERKPAHPKPSVGQPEYWTLQRERLQHSSKPPQPCDSPDMCARAEGVQPVNFADFDVILQSYLSKAQTAGVDAAHINELKKLAAELFQNGVFPHDQMSFQDYVEDVGDILEDLVEGDDGQEESAVEDEMEGFEREVMQRFTLSESGERGRVKGEWREESGRGRA